jgi:hypothetical protein
MAPQSHDTEDVRELLEKNLELNEENNKMLHTMERGARWTRILNIVYWIVIIGSALGAYYFLQPYIESVRKLFEALPGIESMLKSFPGGE